MPVLPSDTFAPLQRELWFGHFVYSLPSPPQLTSLSPVLHLGPACLGEELGMGGGSRLGSDNPFQSRGRKEIQGSHSSTHCSWGHSEVPWRSTRTPRFCSRKAGQGLRRGIGSFMMRAEWWFPQKTHLHSNPLGCWNVT